MVREAVFDIVCVHYGAAYRAPGALGVCLMDALASLDYLTDMEASASRLTRTAVPDDLVADVAGRCQHVERTLAQFRRNLLAEQDTEVDGREYGIRSGGRIATRSYSTAAIFTDFMDALNLDFAGVLHWLIGRDALRLTWRWSELQQAFDAADVGLRKEHHEISNDDLDWHVGEEWSERPMQIVALEGDVS